jgi:hypothetical protein
LTRRGNGLLAAHPRKRWKGFDAEVEGNGDGEIISGGFAIISLIPISPASRRIASNTRIKSCHSSAYIAGKEVSAVGSCGGYGRFNSSFKFIPRIFTGEGVVGTDSGGDSCNGSAREGFSRVYELPSSLSHNTTLPLLLKALEIHFGLERWRYGCAGITRPHPRLHSGNGREVVAADAEVRIAGTINRLRLAHVEDRLGNRLRFRHIEERRGWGHLWSYSKINGSCCVGVVVMAIFAGNDVSCTCGSNGLMWLAACSS